MIVTSLFDPEDSVTYSLIFSREDAELIISMVDGQHNELSSIDGSIIIDKNKACLMYGNGVSQWGSIFTDYSKLCTQLSIKLDEEEDE